MDSVSKFVEDLPIDLKTPLSIHIYETVYTRVEFLKDKDHRFISWICPMLKFRVAAPNEYIFYEGDRVNEIYFVKNGVCDYVLPRHTNTPYIRVVDDSCFGFFDIVAWLLERGKQDDCDLMDDSCSLADQSLSAASEEYQEILGH